MAVSRASELSSHLSPRTFRASGDPAAHVVMPRSFNRDGRSSRSLVARTLRTMRPAHVVALGPEDMLDYYPNRRTGHLALLQRARLSEACCGGLLFYRSSSSKRCNFERRLDLIQAVSSVGGHSPKP